VTSPRPQKAGTRPARRRTRGAGRAALARRLDGAGDENRTRMTSLEEADVLVRLLCAAPAHRLIKGSGPGQIGDAKGYQTDALLHLASIAVDHELCCHLYAATARRLPYTDRPADRSHHMEAAGDRAYLFRFTASTDTRRRQVAMMMGRDLPLSAGLAMSVGGSPQVRRVRSTVSLL
jgi:hypothetical protein